ncbi:DUF397 domain-containing protein [Streptomyces sp. DH37]|uniref:DUF397 domain-containing protein n=1 Tax=Streptomyces sp. DH37 TaxID=3040122 RepID=UPI0034DEC13C
MTGRPVGRLSRTRSAGLSGPLSLPTDCLIGISHGVTAPTCTAGSVSSRSRISAFRRRRRCRRAARRSRPGRRWALGRAAAGPLPPGPEGRHRGHRLPRFADRDLPARDSKRPVGPVLGFGRDAWGAFPDHLR